MVRFACIVGLCLIAFAALSPTGIALAGGADCLDLDRVCDFRVPEPSSWVLLASGLGVLGWALRRRR